MEAKQIAQQDAERAKFIVEKVSWRSMGRTGTDGETGGTGAAGRSDPGGGRGGGSDDDLAGTGEGGGGICGTAEDRGEQSDCAVAGAERKCDVGAGLRSRCPAQCAGVQVDYTWLRSSGYMDSVVNTAKLRSAWETAIHAFLPRPRLSSRLSSV